MNSGKTQPPPPLNESDLISEMDKHGIGTDATIAEHISKIQRREYAVKNGENRFVPTDLGLALVEGYNSMGYQLTKPYLRATMEADCSKIAKGLVSKDVVVKNCMETMKLCLATVYREAQKLESAVAKYFEIVE